MYPNVKVKAIENGVAVIAENLDSAAINRALVMANVNVAGLMYATDNMEAYFIQRMGGKQ